MTAKITKGNDFRGAVDYILDSKKMATLIDSEGVRLKNKESIIDSFMLQQQLKPKQKNPVYHISLNFSASDKAILNSEKMKEIAKEYMEKMGIVNTQYIAVRHFDREHPHLHLCINRIDNNGNAISDRFDQTRSIKICKEQTKKHNLHYAKGKEKVNRDRLRGADKVKYEIYDALLGTVPKAENWSDLQKQLDKQGIHLILKYRGNTNKIQGVVFEKDGYFFTGSKVDRQFSYSKINQQLELEGVNQEQIMSKSTQQNFLHEKGNLLKEGLDILSLNDGIELEDTNNKEAAKRKRKGIKR